jgi:5-methylcytosine-specific restriction endonuclease McrA
MPKGLKGFQKGHKINGGIKFGDGQVAHHKKGKDSPIWKGGKKASKKRYYERNKAKCYIDVITRRARLKGLEGSFTIGEWETLKAQYGFTCPSCQETEPDIKLEADHIIPVVKGGSNYIDNIQPLCRKCNASKHIKVIKFEY